MPPVTLYHYSKTRTQRSRIFLNMAMCCWLYIGGIYAYEHWGEGLPDATRSIVVTSFVISSAVLIAIVWWLRSHPACYEATITTDRFVVKYPNSTKWSFDISLLDIQRFEHRNTLSHAGKGIGKSGVLLKDGTFHTISMNYGNIISDMHRAIQQVHPEISFPSKVNLKVEGLLNKDYDDHK